MSIPELIQCILDATPSDQEIYLLRKSNILDENGYYRTRFFSEKTYGNPRKLSSTSLPGG
ncbi:hypothetical protein CCP3SC1_270012 [Gammaproteobacteria bacterium]